MRTPSLAVISGLAVALIIGACGGQQRASAPTPTVVQTVTAPGEAAVTKAPTSTAPDLESYQGSGYSAQVPKGWTRESDNAPHSGYVESKWRDPTDPRTSLTIDVAAAESTPPSTKADEVRAGVSGQPSYGETSSNSATVAGGRGYVWTFKLSGDQRVDYFANTCNTGVAVLGSTAAARFHELSSTFKKVADSVTVDCSAGASGASTNTDPAPSSPPSTSTSTEADFCSTHDCIPNFPNGTGTIVECNDGKWSHSGGRSGACSSHGGVSGNTAP
jgi:hypothetical protein